MKIVIWCLLLAILFHSSQVVDQKAQAFRSIPIPKRENGYSNFESMVITSKKDLDSFLKDTSTQIGWNNRQDFKDALLNAKLDFNKEALVLLRHTEGSGSTPVTFETPTLRDRTLLSKVEGKPFPPGYGGTTDMAYYCFAVAVSKSQVSQVELQATAGGFSKRPLAPIVLPIIENRLRNEP